jgi:hypothetical protein
MGSVPGIVTLGSIGAALVQQPTISWSGCPSNLRHKKHSGIVLPPGIAAENDTLEESNREWTELKKAHENRLAIEAKRQGKVVKSAKAAEKAVGLEPSPAPKIELPKAAPKKAPAKSARPATKPAAAKQPERPQAQAAAAAPALPALDLSAYNIDPNLAAALHATVTHIAALIGHHRQQQEQAARAQQEASARAAQEVARQQRIVREREAWQRRIATLVSSAHALSTRVQQRTAARPRAH